MRPGPCSPEGPHGGGEVPHPVRLEPGAAAAAVTTNTTAGVLHQEPRRPAGPHRRSQYGIHGGTAGRVEADGIENGVMVLIIMHSSAV